MPRPPRKVPEQIRTLTAGDRIRARRRALGWSPSDLAKRLKVPLSVVHAMERRETADDTPVWDRARFIISAAERETLEAAKKVLRHRRSKTR